MKAMNAALMDDAEQSYREILLDKDLKPAEKAEKILKKAKETAKELQANGNQILSLQKMAVLQ